MRGRPNGVEVLNLNPYARSTVPAIPPDHLVDVSARCVSSGVAVVQVRGEVDLSTAPVLRAELDHQLDQRPTMLVLDLTGVTFFGASGVRVLLEARWQAALTAIPVRLVHTTRAVSRPLDVLHLNYLFPAYPTLAHARAGRKNLPPH
jgi:anti-sigma B factor antagonist